MKVISLTDAFAAKGGTAVVTAVTKSARAGANCSGPSVC